MSKPFLVFIYITSLILSLLIQGVLVLWFPDTISDNGNYTIYLLILVSLIIFASCIKDLIQNKNKAIGIIFLIVSTIVLVLCTLVLLMVGQI